MVRRAESLIKSKRLLLKKEGWSKKRIPTGEESFSRLYKPTGQRIVISLVSIRDFSA